MRNSMTLRRARPSAWGLLLFAGLLALGSGCTSRRGPADDDANRDRFADMRGGARATTRHDFESAARDDGLARSARDEGPDEAVNEEPGETPVAAGPRVAPESPSPSRTPRRERRTTAAEGSRGTDAPRAGAPPRPRAVAAEPEDLAGAVAVIEVQLPRSDRFHLRATVPVPADAPWEHLELPDGRAASPYAFRLAGGEVIACQVERLARRPDGSPEVLELIAPVRRASLPTPDRTGRARVSVLCARDGDEPFAFPDDANFEPAALELLTSTAFALSSRSVDGIEYRALLPRPSGGRVTAEGPYLRRLFVAGVLMPTEDGALQSHLHGYHAHLTLFSGDPRIALDLRLHAGVTSGAEPDTPSEAPVGALYFESIDLELPQDWKALPLFADPFFTATRRAGERSVTALVRPLEGDALHLMPPSFQMQRRLTLAPEGVDLVHGASASPAFEGLGFTIDRGPGRPALWSWSQPETARYFSQRSPLPTANGLLGSSARNPGPQRARLVERRDQLVDMLARGTADGGHVQIGALGWFHPYFHAYQGVSGGDEIRFVEGHYAAVLSERAELERLMAVHRMNTARQSVAMWRADGRPVGVDLWLDDGGRIPFDFRTNAGLQPPELRLPYSHRGRAPIASIEAAAAAERRPSYDRGDTWQPGARRVGEDDCIYGWQPHDGQHLVRHTKNAKALVWLANDGLARDDLILEAERFRLMVHGQTPALPNGVTLTHLERGVEGRPGKGVHINRDHAWGIDAIVGSYAVGDDDLRARFRPWLERFTDLILHAQMPNGLVMRERYHKLLGGRYDAAHAFQVEFLLLARRMLVVGVFEDVDEERAAALRESYRNGLEYMFWGAPFHTAKNGRSGPAGQFAVALTRTRPDDEDLPVFSDAEHWGPNYMPEDGRTGDVEGTYPWDLLAFAEEWTRGPEYGVGLENRYLARATALWDGYRSLGMLLSSMQADEMKRFNSQAAMRCALMARVEQLTSKARR